MAAFEFWREQRTDGIGTPRAATIGGRKMTYAIVFDLDTTILASIYKNDSYPNAYNDIRKVLTGYGFDHQQGSTYFGGASVDAVTCVLAVQEVSSRYDWFAPAVRDIRMLRIEENNDLMPAVERAKNLGTN